jgi:hypothetical protein
MKAPGRILLIAILGLTSATAGAAFHLWRMTEIYSNADGSVQFLELASPSDGEGLVFGHTLRVIVGGVTRTFTFPDNLPFNSRNKRMLVATQGFADLGVVVPDFVVPNGFFAAAGGAVNFSDVDIWSHPPLPADGMLSLQRDGATAVNSPTNFAGRTGTVGAGPAPNFQGLWYKAPAESESGWGVNISHQGDTFFVTWFTYDLDGSQMWLVGPAVRRNAGNAYTGELFRTTGPAFNAVPFGSIAASAVGTVTFSFADADNGTFGYSVNGVTQSKAITRQVFDTPPTCSAGGAPGAMPNFSDLWYRAPAESEPGWGVNITQQGNVIFAAWFTYDATGRGMWVVGPRMERTTGNTFAGPLFRTTGPAFNAVPWNPAGVTALPVGNATLSFTDANSGSFAYTITSANPAIQQTKTITRQVFSTPATVCR